MNNVSCKRVYEKAWRSHLHIGLMLNAGEKQLNQRRKTPQVCFKENCTFYRYIPKQLHTASLICCGYSIKCSAFYNLCLCWSLSERGLGGMQHGKGCCVGKYRVRTSITLGNWPISLWKKDQRWSSEWHLCDSDRCRPGHKNILWWALHVGYPLQGVCAQQGQ